MCRACADLYCMVAVCDIARVKRMFNAHTNCTYLLNYEINIYV